MVSNEYIVYHTHLLPSHANRGPRLVKRGIFMSQIAYIVKVTADPTDPDSRDGFLSLDRNGMHAPQVYGGMFWLTAPESTLDQLKHKFAKRCTIVQITLP